jgi:hypothetical protein
MDDAKVKIKLFDMLGSKEFVAEVPSSARVDRLIPVLASKMNLPLVTNNNGKIKYRFFRAKTAFLLPGDATLADIQTEDDELFFCLPENLASMVTEKPQKDKDQLQGANALSKNNLNLEENTFVFAPVYVPESEDLRVNLIRGELVSELEKCRSDELKFSSIMWTFIGATLGVLINWVTASPFIVSTLSLITLTLFLIMSVLMWTFANDFKKRADKLNFEISRATQNAHMLPKKNRNNPT